MNYFLGRVMQMPRTYAHTLAWLIVGTKRPRGMKFLHARPPNEVIESHFSFVHAALKGLFRCVGLTSFRSQHVSFDEFVLIF
jgi:hypothetical protein